MVGGKGDKIALREIVPIANISNRFFFPVLFSNSINKIISLFC